MSSSSVRVWYKSVCNALSAILSPHQPQRAVITRPPNPPEEIYCNEFYVVSGHSDFGTKFQGKRCFRCQRIEHWARNCRAPWPAQTVQTEVDSLLPTPPMTIDPEEQAQMEQLIQDEHDLTEYIYQDPIIIMGVHQK